jgi:hypothetical protein
MIKKILISLLFVYIFFADIIISVLEINSLKSILSALIFFLTFIYFSINYKKLIFKQFIIVPIFLIVVFVLIWKDLGYINLFYTTIFGYILAQDYSFSKRMLLFTFIIQLILTVYERITLSVIYTTVVSGVINENSYDYGKSFELFDVTGFRPKGLFPGTLIGSSFIIYLAMFYRNNIRILLLLFASAIIINGRLATVVVGFTLLLRIFKKYDIIIIDKIGLIKKQLFYIIPVILLFLLFSVITPEVILNNFLNTFDFNSMANAGRIYAYGQSLLLFISYTPIEKLFGSPGNEVFDIYDRLIASESGVISMFLDIGIVGFLYYLYYFILVFKIDKSSFFNFKSKYIGLKYVVIVTFLSFFQYEHINGNLRGTLFWFMIISIFYKFKISKSYNII